MSVSRSRVVWAQVALVALVSLGFEMQFVHHSINLMDEGWPLYAAMGLHEGGSLYREVFWVFPPGHLLAAWIGYAVQPPGLVVSRLIYAGFTVALVVACVFLGRRIMPGRYAVFAALLLAVCGTSAHRLHLLFGFRYLVFAVLALLAFARRLDTGDRRWTFLSGVATGVALIFRITPAFAVSVGILAAIIVSDRSWRSWLRDGVAFAGGVLLITVPVVVWFAYSVGPETFWREAVVRPVVMTSLQSLPMPRLSWLPMAFERDPLMRWFVAWQYRLYPVLYAAYLLYVGGIWIRSLRSRTPPPQPILVALVVFGAVYFARTLGRSDSAHLYSAIPPVCILLGHALWKAVSHFQDPSRARTRRLEWGLLGLLLSIWIYGMGSEIFLLDAQKRGLHPLESTAGRVAVNGAEYARLIDGTVAGVRARTKPGDRILVLGNAPLLHVLSGRPGLGHADLILPGTFMDTHEESRFLARVKASPPALVVWSGETFDRDPMRHPKRAAPLLAAWVRRTYQRVGGSEEFKLLARREPSADHSR